MRIVDVWSQITTPRMAREPWMSTLQRWTRRAEDNIQSVASTLAAMNDAGIDIAFFVSLVRPHR